MMVDKQISLQWKAFEPTVMNSFQTLYMDEGLADVTLACEGNHQILAHKVVLSACSNLFKQILANNRNPHPLIYLQGLDRKDLLLLKMSMYLGKATIEERNVNTFMSVSKMYLNKTADVPNMKENKNPCPSYQYTEIKPCFQINSNPTDTHVPKHQNYIPIETNKYDKDNLKGTTDDIVPTHSTKTLAVQDAIQVEGQDENRMVPLNILCN